MLKFYYNPKYKYTNRVVINLENDSNYVSIDYENIDSPDTINGHIIYSLDKEEVVPTYIVEDDQKRWFVTGITQLRTGKFQISVLRDIISESRDWTREKAYITAGTANDYNKYKTWGLPFTNTKVKQERLNINGKSSFFVFYVNTQKITDSVLSESDLKIKSSSIPGITSYDFTVKNLNEIPGYEYVGPNKNVWYFTNRALIITADMDTGNGTYDRRCYNILAQENNIEVGSAFNVTTDAIFLNSLEEKVRGNENNCLNDLKTAMMNYMSSYEKSKYVSIPKITYDELNKYVDKYIYNSTDNKVYTIRRNIVFSRIGDIDYIDKEDSQTLQSAMRNINFPPYKAYGPIKESHLSCTGTGFVEFKRNSTRVEYSLQVIGTATSLDFNFKSNVRKLPKSAVRCVNIVSDSTILDSDVAQALMIAQTNGINKENDTGRILDIQYLPFSVASSRLDEIKINNQPMIAQFLDNDDYSYSIDLPDLENINKETDTIKIVSPSRATQFLFRPYNNDGNMQFNTKITLKPNASIIYVRPSTKGLLLADWDDKDCLVIQEDFSLTNVSSAWTNYIYNNKNYQNTFNRQIQGRELQREWERRVEKANAVSDDWNARNISAKKAQTYTGNIPLISGIAGAIGTAWKDAGYMQAAQLDREYNEAMYQESINISRDMFRMQLENIQAQPNIPTSITTIDVKLLDGVYLEFYSTNATEKTAIENFYKFNGNRIDSFGTFSQYLGKFVRGRIIVSDIYTQPELNELNRRLENGIFTEEV